MSAAITTKAGRINEYTGWGGALQTNFRNQPNTFARTNTAHTHSAIISHVISLIKFEFARTCEACDAAKGALMLRAYFHTYVVLSACAYVSQPASFACNFQTKCQTRGRMSSLGQPKCNAISRTHNI